MPLGQPPGSLGGGFALWLLAFSGGVTGCSTDASNATSSTVKAVASDALAGKTVSACRVGAAHPNVCCTGGPSLPATCDENIETPFGACDSTALTFPDPTQCCPLDGGACSSASAAGPPNGTCSFLCGPGGYWPGQLPAEPGHSLATCTPSMSSGDPCVFCCDPAGNCASNESSCPSNGCSGGLTNLQCAACPAGWSVPPTGQFDLCCRSGSDGSHECFSQSAEVALNDGSFGCVSDSATACTCTEITGDGHVLVARCDAASSPACVCSLDGTTTSTIASFGGCAPLVLVTPPEGGLPSIPTASDVGTLLGQCSPSMP